MDNKVASSMIDKLDCACLIHGDKYNWQYVENLYSMVKRHVSCEINFHVFTESNREVPGHMIKHVLTEWPGIAGPKKSWWYKMQIFDPARLSGPVLYLDLDVVIVGDLDWIRSLSTQQFWIIRDWKHLWKPSWYGTNSSVMFWDIDRFKYIWDGFCKLDINEVVHRYRGDQDYLTAVLPEPDRSFFQEEFIKSWRWQIKDGGLNFKTRNYLYPGRGSVLDTHTKIMVFHGSPKPHEIDDRLIIQSWT